MKLPEEAISIMEAESALDKMVPTKILKAMLRGGEITMAALSLSTVPQWIPVSTLPKVHQPILIYGRGIEPNIISGYLEEDNGPLFVGDDGIPVYNASHWMIPTPPLPPNT